MFSFLSDEDISILIRVSNHRASYIVDCGTASLLSPGDCTKLEAIFITHTHIDHFINFDSILRFNIGLKKIISIFGPAGIAENVKGKLKSYVWNLIPQDELLFKVYEIFESGISEFRISPPDCQLNRLDSKLPEILYSNNAFSVDCRILDHKIPSIAYLFKEPDSLHIEQDVYKPGPWIKTLKDAYNQQNNENEIIIDNQKFKAKELYQYLKLKPGYRLGVAMDHLPSQENHNKLIDLFQSADEIFIESFYRDIDREFAIRHHHSTAKESGKLAQKAGVKKLNLVHHSRRYHDEIDDLIEEGMAEFEGREPQFKAEPVSRY